MDPILYSRLVRQLVLACRYELIYVCLGESALACLDVSASASTCLLPLASHCLVASATTTSAPDSWEFDCSASWYVPLQYWSESFTRKHHSCAGCKAQQVHMLPSPEPGISVFGRLSVSHSAPLLGSPTCTTSQWIDPDLVDRHLVLLATLTGIGLSCDRRSRKNSVCRPDGGKLRNRYASSVSLSQMSLHRHASQSSCSRYCRLRRSFRRWSSDPSTHHWSPF